MYVKLQVQVYDIVAPLGKKLWVVEPIKPQKYGMYLLNSMGYGEYFIMINYG